VPVSRARPAAAGLALVLLSAAWTVPAAAFLENVGMNAGSGTLEKLKPGKFTPAVVNVPPRFSVPPVTLIALVLLQLPFSVSVVPVGTVSPALLT